ncbi:sigma-70 family RNA polymerase sigma factor [Streptomyces sp. NBC_01283]|uniref:sigma-70 family RNA polymerase sigma factor n=1 Tax=Streptomyces sp. NBC_01283 TaxID=2903812 RepID=UPI00352D828F
MDQNEAAVDRKAAISGKVAVEQGEALAARFEEHRPHLKAVAYRMLGSLNETEDAVQESWIRLSRSDISEVANLGGWLTTVVGRICLDMLRTRQSRREDSLSLALDTHVPDPVVSWGDVVDPEQEVLLADSVGLALLVVLETLAPAERLAFVLHDMFAVPFDEVAPIVERTPAATRQLASRARRRVQDSAPTPDNDPVRQREVVGAFLAAARGGDFDALLELLDPDVVLRADTGELASGLSKLVRGASVVAGQAAMFSKGAPTTELAFINGRVGAVGVPDGEVVSVMEFTIAGGRIVELNILVDPARVRALNLPAFRR